MCEDSEGRGERAEVVRPETIVCEDRETTLLDVLREVVPYAGIALILAAMSC